MKKRTHRDFTRLEGVEKGSARKELARVSDVAAQELDPDNEEVGALLDLGRRVLYCHLRLAHGEAAAPKHGIIWNAEAHAHVWNGSCQILQVLVQCRRQLALACLQARVITSAPYEMQFFIIP